MQDDIMEVKYHKIEIVCGIFKNKYAQSDALHDAHKGLYHLPRQMNDDGHFAPKGLKTHDCPTPMGGKRSAFIKKTVEVVQRFLYNDSSNY